MNLKLDKEVRQPADDTEHAKGMMKYWSKITFLTEPQQNRATAVGQLAG